MQSLWNDADAKAFIAQRPDVSEDLALRTYSARLLGADVKLVLHGGGNTSVKTMVAQADGTPVQVLCVKGSGWDLATIEPPGHPAVRLAPLLDAQKLSCLSDEDMVALLRRHLIDPKAPNPSVEALLHAFLPHKFIDHTHSTAILSITNQADGVELCQRLYGHRVAVIPYVMPGFDLALATARAVREQPDVEGVILAKHGIFSFGATARESYERMISLVSVAEEHVRAKASPAQAAPAPHGVPVEPLLATLRGLLARCPGHAQRWLLDLREDGRAGELARHAQAGELARRGVATPDHVIRTKRAPLVLPRPGADLAAWGKTCEPLVAAFADEYRAYFARHNANEPVPKTMLDPVPRLVLVEGVGIVGVGNSVAAAGIAADLAQAWAESVLDAEAIGRFESITEAQTFEMEYWSLEQAKLGKAGEPPLARHVVVVTGAASGIGRATAKAFAKQGATVRLIDRDADAVKLAAKDCGAQARGLACDLTDSAQVAATMRAIARECGGLDIVVSNAGIAQEGAIATVSSAVIQQSLNINLFAHLWVAQAAHAVWAAQGIGGCLLFNVSKQALNPGPKFGPYGISKSALMALMRQCALEFGADGVRVNAINADRIRSGLLNDDMIARRAASRGIDEKEYMAGNLLHREVTADDVAQAFVSLAGMLATTGAVLTVDGGNVAAMVR